jgi:WD40 repeat protein
VRPAAPVAAARTPGGGLILIPLRGDLRRAIAHTRLLTATASGDRVAAAVQDPDGHVRPWLFRGDGTRIRVLPSIGINDIAFSPDGQQVATVGATGLDEIWNAKTGSSIEEMKDAKSGANAVAFSPDSKLLATGGQDSGVRIWTVATRARTYFFSGHTNPVTLVAWSPDGRNVASGSPDRTIRLWRVRGPAAPSLAATLAGQNGKITALAFSADGTRLVSGAEDSTVRVWNALPDEMLAPLGRAPGEALQVRWVTGSIVGMWSSGVVKVYDPVSRRVTQVLRSRTGQGFTSLGVSSDASVIAAGGARGATDVWDGKTGERLTARSGAAAVRAVAVSPDGRTVASADRRGVLRVWRPRARGPAWSVQTGRAIVDVSFSPKGDELVTAGTGGAVIWSAATGKELHPLSSPGGDTKAVFSPDGRLVATAGTDTNARLWFAGSGAPYRVLRGHTKAVLDVTFTDDGSLVGTSGADSDGRIWTVATGVHYPLQRTAFGPVRAIDFDSTGQWVAATGPISVIIWSVPRGRQLFYLRGHTGLLTDVAFAPSMPSLVSSARDGTLRTYQCDVCTDLGGMIHLAERRLAQTR